MMRVVVVTAVALALTGCALVKQMGANAAAENQAREQRAEQAKQDPPETTRCRPSNLGGLNCQPGPY